MQGLLDIKTYLYGASKKHSLLSGSVLSFVLVCSLVFAQAVSLNHSHDGDLRDQVDCEICLKVGSSDDVLASTSDLKVTASTGSTYSLTLLAATHIVARTASARAPPHA